MTTLYLYQNTDVFTRIWPDVQRPDGSTLELVPGGTAELDHKVNAAYLTLQPTPKSPTTPPVAAEPKES